VSDWVLWLVVAGVLVLAEVFTLTFVLGLFGVAAAIAGAGAALDLPVVGQIGLFAGAAAAMWVVIRPLERAHRRQPALATGTAALTGRKALVTDEVTAHHGRVKIGGESWAARALTPDMVLAPGTHVAVAEVEGATLVVFPEEI
jgi:membrane protein implicated in regulation of membrane protease activity